MLKPEYEAGQQTTGELKEFLTKYIAVYKLPREFEYAESLPRTPTGKLLRRKLRKKVSGVSNQVSAQ